MVIKADAVASKHAVMISFEDANIAGGTVPRSANILKMIPSINYD